MTGGRTRATSTSLGCKNHHIDDACLGILVLQGMSSRERVARREAPVIDDDKNVALHVQNDVETIQLPREQGYQVGMSLFLLNDHFLPPSCDVEPGFIYDHGLKDRRCFFVRVVRVQNVKHQKRNQRSPSRCVLAVSFGNLELNNFISSEVQMRPHALSNTRLVDR
jgi:hypothetical protein